MEIGYEIKLEKSTKNHKSSHQKKIMKVLSNIKNRNVISFDYTEAVIVKPNHTKRA